jgi:Fe-S oxidoreductase
MMADDADPATLRVGARTLRDLSWKDGFDAFTCTECGRCKDPCPTFLTGKPLSQKWVHDGIKRQLLEQREVLRTPVPAGGEDALPALVGSGPGPSGGSAISEEALWACTTCGACEAACPIELEHLPKIFRLRQHQVLMEGEFPHALKSVFEAWESQGNPWGLPSGQRADWARDLDVPRWRDAADGNRFELLFYVGSAQSYDPRGQKIARAFVQVLRAAGVRFAILGEDEGSTGECARRLGNEMLFQQLAGTLAGTLSERGVRRIVTCDPHAFNALKNELPGFAPDSADEAAAGSSGWTVEHHSQCIARLVREGRLVLAQRWQRVAFHDPCYLGRHNDEFAAPRAVLRGVVTDALLEPVLTREQAMCCGAGGGRMWLEETIGRRINVLRTEQLLATAPAVLATACPYCALMLDDGLKALAAPGREQGVLVKDIAELVAEALVAAAAPSAETADAAAQAARRDPIESVITP